MERQALRLGLIMRLVLGLELMVTRLMLHIHSWVRVVTVTFRVYLRLGLRPVLGVEPLVCPMLHIRSISFLTT
jgi:hypothetical protein